MLQRVTEWVHEWKVKDRRAHIISDHISELIPDNSSILDVGCGDGKIAYSVSQKTSSTNTQGIDVLVREDCSIPVSEFDGIQIPYPDNSFDFSFLVDVLHHTKESGKLLKECRRVSKKGILIKDHYNNSFWDYITLRFMDKVGNARYDVHLPHIYFSEEDWKKTFNELRLREEKTRLKLKLYPTPFNLIFDRKLHFITLLKDA